MTPEALEAGSALCTECGLCCTGAIHDVAKLDPDELEPARALGLPVSANRERPSFHLPCPKLDAAFCTIYGERPRVCARYSCRLLDQVREGGRTLDEALPLVREGQRLARQAAAFLRPGEGLPATRELLVDGGADNPLLMLHGAALAVYMDRHFRNGREGAWLAQPAVASDDGVKS